MFTRSMRNSYSAANQLSGTHAQVGQRVLDYAPAKFIPACPTTPYIDWRAIAKPATGSYVANRAETGYRPLAAFSNAYARNTSTR